MFINTSSVVLSNYCLVVINFDFSALISVTIACITYCGCP